MATLLGTSLHNPRGVHYNRGVGSLKLVREQLAKTFITLEPHGIF